MLDFLMGGHTGCHNPARIGYRRTPSRSLGCFAENRLRFLGRSRTRGRVLVVLRLKLDRGLSLELLVVLVTDGFLQADVVFLEVQRGIGGGVSWEPVFAVDLFAIGLELGVIFLALLLVRAHAAAVRSEEHTSE